MTEWIDLAVLGRILLGALLLGAGLPAVFALGLRAVASGQRPADARATGAAPGRPAAGLGWMALAGTCFLVVLVAVAVGIVFIVRG